MTITTKDGHPAACGPYCAKQHCACGEDAAHGSKQCLSCARAARLQRVITDTDRAMMRGRLTRASRSGLTARLARKH